jgi:MFS family permease
MRRSLLSILVIMFLDVASIRLAFPLLVFVFFNQDSPILSHAVSHNQRALYYGLAISLPSIIGFISLPLMSVASDYFGRKKILLLALCGAAFYALLAAIALAYHCLWLFFLSCILQGLFAKTNPIAQAVIADITPLKDRIMTMGYLQTAISFGAFIAPMIGGFLFHFGGTRYVLPFLVALGFAVFGLVFCRFFFKESLLSHQRDQANVSVAAFKTLWEQSSIRHLSYVLLFFQLAWSFFYQYIPVLLKNQCHFNASMMGIYVGMIAFWLIVASSLGVRGLKKYFEPASITSIALASLCLGCFLFLLALWTNSLWLVWISALFSAAGDVIAYSCVVTRYSYLASHKQQGAVMAICFVVVSLSWSLTGLLGGFLLRFNPNLPLFCALGFGLLALFFYRHPGRGLAR